LYCPQNYTDTLDWAHFEDFCRRLTQKYVSVRIFTGPLYLPRQYPDGKWRVTYEMIGSPPSVAVPTHFFKVILGEGTENGPVAVAAFVLPNQEINNNTALTAFLAPIEAVERLPLRRMRVDCRASGLEFLKDLPIERRRELCQDVDCSIVVREFENRTQQVRRLSAP
jgi:endonuclease G, mitochondrial